MKNRKMNVDRPQLTTNEVMAGKSFDTIVSNHQFMSKPFYKQGWFFGTTGLASLGIIIGGTLAFQSSGEESYLSGQLTTTEAPPNWTVPDDNLIVLGAKSDEAQQQIAEKTIVVNLNNETPIDETFTQENLSNTTAPLTNEVKMDPPTVDYVSGTDTDNLEENELVEEKVVPVSHEKTRNSFLDMSPRISDKIGGSITRGELLDNKGITTEGDINVIHFELHLIDGLGGKVYAEEGNQLNQEMKDALEKVGQGETIYFENIRGKVKNGTEVRLNPMRYVLMN